MIITASVLLAENGNRITLESSSAGLALEPTQYLASDTATLSLQHTLKLLKNGSISIYLEDLFGVLVSVGTNTKSIRRVLFASLSFLGKKLHGPILASALSFLGILTKRTVKVFITFFALLTESGDRITTESGDHIGIVQPTALSFLGNFAGILPGRITVALASTLSFIGTVQKSTFRSITATLSFIGVIKKQSTRSFVGILSFAGNLFSLIPINKMLTASLSFIGLFIRGRLLESVLSFVGTFRKFAPFIHLSSTLSFVGVVSKNSSRSFAAILSSIGNILISKIIAFLVMSGALSFIGGHIKIAGKNLISVLSWIGDLVRKFNNTFFKFLASTVSFSGIITRSRTYAKMLTAFLLFRTQLFSSRVSTSFRKFLNSTLHLIGSINVVPSFFIVFLESRLRFKGLWKNAWGNLVALFNVLITTVGQTILGVSREDHQSLIVTDSQQIINDTPTVLDTGPALNLAVLFIKNLDDQATVEIDSASTFDQFPQRIIPLSGVYLAPENTSTVYAKSSAVTSNVQVITASRSPPMSRSFSPVLQLTGLLDARKVSDLYVSFRVNSNATGTPEFIHIIDATGKFFAIYMFQSGVNQTMEWYGWDSHRDSANTLSLNTYYTAEMKLSLSGGIWTITPRLDGVELLPFSDASIGSLVTVQFGAPTASGITGDNHHLDDLKIGRAGWGSSNIFFADFTSSIVPPFDSISGTGLSLDSGALLVDDAVGNTYAVVAISFP